MSTQRCPQDTRLLDFSHAKEKTNTQKETSSKETRAQEKIGAKEKSQRKKGGQTGAKEKAHPEKEIDPHQISRQIRGQNRSS